eukprot:180237-Rhodomonas_salina.3
MSRPRLVVLVPGTVVEKTSTVACLSRDESTSGHKTPILTVTRTAVTKYLAVRSTNRRVVTENKKKNEDKIQAGENSSPFALGGGEEKESGQGREAREAREASVSEKIGEKCYWSITALSQVQKPESDTLGTA